MREAYEAETFVDAMRVVDAFLVVVFFLRAAVAGFFFFATFFLAAAFFFFLVVDFFLTLARRDFLAVFLLVLLVAFLRLGLIFFLAGARRVLALRFALVLRFATIFILEKLAYRSFLLGWVTFLTSVFKLPSARIISTRSPSSIPLDERKILPPFALTIA